MYSTNNQNKLTAFRPVLLAMTSVIFLAVLHISCNNSIDAFKENNLFSVYGLLNASKDSNYIRVKKLSKPLPADCTHTLNAVVTLKNLQTGMSQVLKDSIVRFDGVYTHNLLTTMDIVPGSSYRLTVEGSNGNAFNAEASVPPIVNPDVQIVYPDVPIPSDPPPPCQATIIFKFNPVKEFSNFRYQHTLNAFSASKVKACYRVGQECPFNGCTGDCAFGRCRSRSPGDNYCEVHRLYDENTEYTGTRKITLGEVFGMRKTQNGTTCGVIIRWKHFSEDAFKKLPLPDSLDIPGGGGVFGGYYTKSLFLKFPPNPNL